MGFVGSVSGTLDQSKSRSCDRETKEAVQSESEGYWNFCTLRFENFLAVSEQKAVFLFDELYLYRSYTSTSGWTPWGNYSDSDQNIGSWLLNIVDSTHYMCAITDAPTEYFKTKVFEMQHGVTKTVLHAASQRPGPSSKSETFARRTYATRYNLPNRKILQVETTLEFMQEQQDTPLVESYNQQQIFRRVRNHINIPSVHGQGYIEWEIRKACETRILIKSVILIFLKNLWYQIPLYGAP